MWDRVVSHMHRKTSKFLHLNHLYTLYQANLIWFYPLKGMSVAVPAYPLLWVGCLWLCLHIHYYGWRADGVLSRCDCGLMMQCSKSLFDFSDLYWAFSSSLMRLVQICIGLSPLPLCVWFFVVVTHFHEFWFLFVYFHPMPFSHRGSL